MRRPQSRPRWTGWRRTRQAYLTVRAAAPGVRSACAGLHLRALEALPRRLRVSAACKAEQRAAQMCRL